MVCLVKFAIRTLFELNRRVLLITMNKSSMREPVNESRRQKKMFFFPQRNMESKNNRRNSCIIPLECASLTCHLTASRCAKSGMCLYLLYLRVIDVVLV